MVGLTISKSGKGFGSIPDKNPCKRPGCFQKGRFKCKYCNLLFCERHIAPLPYGYINDFDKKGHNCYNLPTNKTINDIIKEYPYLVETYNPPKPNPPKPPKPLKPTHKRKKKKIFIGFIFLVIVSLIIISIFFYIKYQEKLKAEYDKLPKCYDGTPYDNCSINKPYYCINGTLRNNTNICGCPEGYIVDFQNCKKLPTSSNESIKLPVTGNAVNIPSTAGNAITDVILENEVQLDKEKNVNSGEKKITYAVSEECFSLTKDLIDKSFFNINDAMDNKFDFIKVNDNADITLYCHSYKYDQSPNYHYCDDNYCYTESSAQAIGLSEGNLIDNDSSIINLYTGAMGLASIEHEIIHSLGVTRHSVYGYSVMSPYSDPSEDQYIDNETVTKLKELYP